MSRSTSKLPAGAGRHPARQNLDSTTTREKRAQAGELVCKSCGAQYHEKHWYTIDQSLKFGDNAKMKETLCPGCYRVQNKIFNGRVVLQGSVLRDKPDELMKVIERVTHECWLDNPTSQMFDVDKSDGQLELKTTTEWLATRIGKSLKRAYKGELHINSSPDKRNVDVVWNSH